MKKFKVVLKDKNTNKIKEFEIENNSTLEACFMLNLYISDTKKSGQADYEFISLDEI